MGVFVASSLSWGAFAGASNTESESSNHMRSTMEVVWYHSTGAPAVAAVF